MEEKNFGNVSVLAEEGCTRLKLSGEADMDFVNAFSRAAQTLETEKERKPLVVDLSQTRYIDSPTVAVFARLIKLYQKKKQRVVLFRPNEMLRQIFEQTGLAKLVDLCANEKELLKILGR